MPTNTVKTVDVGVVPFFARFLEEQVTEGGDPPTTPPTTPPLTFKFPSDWEDPSS